MNKVYNCHKLSLNILAELETTSMTKDLNAPRKSTSAELTGSSVGVKPGPVFVAYLV